MAGTLEKFAETSNSYKWFGVGVIVAALLGAFWYFKYDPDTQKIKRLERERQDLSKRVAEAEGYIKNYEKFKQEKEKVQAELDEALKKLPKSKDVPTLLEDINKSVITAGLNISLFQPGPPADKELYSEFLINLNVTGGYHNFAAFTDTISKLDRIVTISSINMAPASDENLAISAQAMAYTSK